MRIPTYDSYITQYRLLAQQFQILNHLTAQQSKQEILINPSDDPILSGEIENITDYVTNISSYTQNGILALNRSTLLDSAASASVNTADQIKQILVRANNDTLQDSDRVVLANELQGLLGDLYNIANRQDGSNSYLFSGTNNTIPAYGLQNGVYVFNGTQDNTTINIGLYSSIDYDQSGYPIFDHIFSGNGVFGISAASSNTGSGTTSVGAVTDASAYVSDTYTLTYVTNSAGHLAYQVVGAASGQVIPPPPATIPADAPDYVQGSDVSFNGMTLTVTGQPNVGDSFQIAPSVADNAFNIINSFAKLLSTPIGSDVAKRAQLHQALTTMMGSASTLFNQCVSFESEIGQRQATIQNQNDVNEEILNNSEITLSQLRDADPMQIETQLQQQNVAIQAAQSAYMQIQAVLMSLLKMIQ